jgi:hypothetical protein
MFTAVFVDMVVITLGFLARLSDTSVTLGFCGWRSREKVSYLFSNWSMALARKTREPIKMMGMPTINLQYSSLLYSWEEVRQSR